jgi:hypothetical protein
VLSTVFFELGKHLFPMLVGQKESKQIQLTLVWIFVQNQVYPIYFTALRPTFQARDPFCNCVERGNLPALDNISQAWQTYLPIIGRKHPKRIQWMQG